MSNPDNNFPPIPPSTPPAEPNNPPIASVRPSAVNKLDAVDKIPCAVSIPPPIASAAPPKFPTKKDPIIEDADENNEFTVPPIMLVKKLPTNDFAVPIILLKAQEIASKTPVV